MHQYTFSFTSDSNPDLASNAVFPANLVPSVPEIGDRIICADFKNSHIDGIVTTRAFRFDSEMTAEGNEVYKTVVLFNLEIGESGEFK